MKLLLFLLVFLCFYSSSSSVGDLRDYDWDGAVLRVSKSLNQSIEFYANEIFKRGHSAPDLLRAHLNISWAVWIVDGKLYAHENFIKGLKNRLHLRFMQSILSGREWDVSPQVAEYLQQLKTGKKIVGYSYSSGSSGALASKFDSIPTFVIAKKHSHPRGILFPNPYFNDLPSWDHEMSKLMSIADEKDWDSRIHRVFWRGKLNAQLPRNLSKCDSTSGNFARLSASVLTVTNPKFFDVRATNCVMKWNSTFCADVYNYTQSEIEALSNCAPLHGETVPHRNFSDYSMFLDLPGSTQGSYSRNLNHLWLMGGVVFIWTGPLTLKDGAEQWYSPALKDKHTHRVIDRKTAKFAVYHILTNPEERKYLVANGREVAKRFLCADCLVEYALTALMKMEQRIPALSTLLNHPHHRQARKVHTILKEACQKQKWVRVDDLDEKSPKRIFTSDGQELCEKLAPPNKSWSFPFNLFKWGSSP